MTAAVLLLLFVALRFLPGVAWPVLLATASAYLLDPLVTRMARTGLGRTRSTALLYVVFGVLAVVLAVLLGPRLAVQAARLPEYLFELGTGLLKRLELAGVAVPADWHALGAMVTADTGLLSGMLPSAGRIIGSVLGGSFSLLSVLLPALVVPMVGFSMLRGWPDRVRQVRSLVPPAHRAVWDRHMRAVDVTLAGFVRGQLTMAAVLSFLYSTVLSLVGLKLAVVVGLVTGLGNLVPYVGTALGLLLSTAFCIFDFGVDYHLAMVIGAFALLLALDSVFITPRIVGNRVGLSPSAVILSVMLCGALFGFAGVLLAVPTAAVLRRVLVVATEAYRQSRLFA